LGVTVSGQYPLVGDDAFRTATGVHAAAVIKAIRKGDVDLADRIYSGVPAGWFGKQQSIEIGFMSGESNVVFWLQQRGIEPSPDLVKQIFDLAKRTDRLLRDAEVHAVVEAWRAAGG
jgi:2-isopropylmalate synthase